ncbi:EamA-like transporter family protein, partial [Bordetella bronchiseptica E012]
MILSMWTLSGLDASGKWVMAAGVPLLVLCWVRYLVHLVLVLTLVLPARGLRILRATRPREQIVRGAAMFCATLLFFTTLSYLPQAEATAINFLAPLIVLSIAPWVLKEPPRLSRWVAAGVAFLGVLIVIRPDGGLHPLGVMFGLLTACCFAAQYIATRKVAGDDPYTSLIWSGAVGALCLTAALPLILPPALPVLRELSLGNWLLLLSTGVSGALGHLLQIGAYRNAAASTLAPFRVFRHGGAPVARPFRRRAADRRAGAGPAGHPGRHRGAPAQGRVPGAAQQSHRRPVARRGGARHPGRRPRPGGAGRGLPAVRGAHLDAAHHGRAQRRRDAHRIQDRPGRPAFRLPGR